MEFVCQREMFEKWQEQAFPLKWDLRILENTLLSVICTMVLYWQLIPYDTQNWLISFLAPAAPDIRPGHYWPASSHTLAHHIQQRNNNNTKASVDHLHYLCKGLSIYYIQYMKMLTGNLYRGYVASCWAYHGLGKWVECWRLWQVHSHHPPFVHGIQRISLSYLHHWSLSEGLWVGISYAIPECIIMESSWGAANRAWK